MRYILTKSQLILLGLIALLFLALPLAKYFTLHSSFCDLGIFSTNIFNAGIEESWRCFFGHSHIYQIFYANFAPLNFSSSLLIFLQSLAILSSLRIIYAIEKKYLFINSIVFLLCYGVWYNAFFDFHYDHLAIPLGFIFYYFSQKNKFKYAVLVGILISFIKEPFALMTSFMGLYLILKHKKYFLGVLLILYGAGYFYIATYYVIPFFTPTYEVVGASKGAFANGGSLVDIAFYPILHFSSFIMDILTTKKIIYLIALLTSFGLFVVIFSPLELIPALPLLAISMLSNIENYYWYNTHYTAPLIAPFMVAFIYGLPKYILFLKKYFFYFDSDKKIILFIFIPILISHILFSPSPMSRFFWINKLPSFYYTAYMPSKRNNIIKQALMTYIPNDPNIAVSTQNSLHWDYLAQRKYYFLYPQGVSSTIRVESIDVKNPVILITSLLKNDKSVIHIKNIKADFVVIDFNRPLFLGDRMVSYGNFKAIFDKILLNYSVIYTYDKFFILKEKQ